MQKISTVVPFALSALLAACGSSETRGSAPDTDGDASDAGVDVMPDTADVGDATDTAAETTPDVEPDVPDVMPDIEVSPDVPDVEVTPDVEVSPTFPTPVDDAYDAVAHVALAVGTLDETPSPAITAAGSLLANDTDPLGGTLSLTTVGTFASAGGGSVTVEADGSFVYTSAAGATGSDTFTYTVANAEGEATATATITLAERVWFVDLGSAEAGDGTASSPLQTIDSALALALEGDTVWVKAFDGAAASAQVVPDGVRLLGGGVALETEILADGDGFPFTLVEAGDAPMIVALGGPAVTLEGNNTLAGFALEGGEQGGVHVPVTSAGPVAIRDVEILVAGAGAGIALENGTVGATLSNVSVSADTPGTTVGLRVDALADLVNVVGVSIDGTALAVAATELSGELRLVGVAAGSSVPVSAGVEVAGTGTLTLEGLTVSADAGPALLASGCVVAGTTGALESTAGAALDGTDVGLDLTVASLRSDRAPASGVSLANVSTASALVVSGTTVVEAPTSHGVHIDGVAAGAVIDLGDVRVERRGADGVLIIDHNGNAIELGTLFVDNALDAPGNGVTVRGVTGPSAGLVAAESVAISDTFATVRRLDDNSDGAPDRFDDDGHGVRIVDHLGGFQVRGTDGAASTISNVAADGVSVVRSGSLTLNGLTIDNIGVANFNDGRLDNAGIWLFDIVDDVRVTGSTVSRFQDGGIADGDSGGVWLFNSSADFGTVALTDVAFFNDAVALGGDALYVETAGSTSGTFQVNSTALPTSPSNNNQYYNLTGSALVVEHASSGTLDVTFRRASVRDAAPGVGFGNIAFSATGTGTLNAVVDSSSFRRLAHLGVNNGGVVSFYADGTAALVGQVVSSTFGGGDVASAGRGAIRATTSGDAGAAPSRFDITIRDNDIDGTAREAISVFVEGGTPNANIVIEDNVLGANSPVASTGREGIEVRALGPAKTVSLSMLNNTIVSLADSTSDETVDIDVEDSATLNATLLGNNLVLGAGSSASPNSLEVTTEDAGATVCLNINTAAASGSPNTVDDGILLDGTSGTFGIVDGGADPSLRVATRNVGTLSTSGTLSTCSLP